MALSNIAREPRREIIETVVGLVIFTAFMGLDYTLAVWIEGVTGGPHDGLPWQVGMLFGIPAGGAAIFLALFIHFLGETVCDTLQRNGIHLRPRNRY